MKPFLLSFLTGLIWILSGNSAYGKAPCAMDGEETLLLHAYIEKDLIDCVRNLDLTQLEIVSVNSGGGDVETTIAVGELIAPYRPHIIIKKHCHSSCANYWLPLARKITFEKDARLMIHGGIDPGFIKMMIEREVKDATKLQKLVTLQDNYIARHNIHRGWVQYRTDYTKGMDAYAPWLMGKASIPDSTKTIKLLMVNAPLLQSCLPDIELEGFNKSYAATASEKKWRKLAKKGQVSSGTMVCSSP